MAQEKLSPVTSKEEQATGQVPGQGSDNIQQSEGSDAGKGAVKRKRKTKKAYPIKEEDYQAYLNNRTYVEISLATAEEKWDGSPLQKDVVYHENKLGGAPIYWLEPNRRTYARAMKMLDACHNKGMTTPAVVVRAELAHAWNLKLIDPANLKVVPEDKIAGAYAIMEGHGRHYASLAEKAIADKDADYKPFDFKFVFEDYETPEAFGAAYLSTNEDMTKTTNKDRLKIAGSRCTNPLVIKFNALVKEGVIAKAAQYRVYGRELSAEEANAITTELPTAPKFDQELTDALAKVYKAFKDKFSSHGAEKIYRGVAAAKWSATQVCEAKDKTAVADEICGKVAAMNNDIYTGILTAKTVTKKHQTREQVIQGLLDDMMK